MKVFLVNPSHQPKDFPRELVELSRHSGTQIDWHQDFPFDFAYIQEMLKGKGIGAVVWDEHSLGIERKETLREIKKVKPDIVGIETDSACNWGCPVPTTEHAEKLIAEVKSIGAGIKTVAMGPQLTGPFNESSADFVIKNEFEGVFVELVEGIERPEKVKGIIFGSEEGRKETMDAEPLNLSKLPVPGYEGVELDKYRVFKVEFSRGCPFGCSFCFNGMFGRRHRHKKPEKFAEELANLNQYGKEFIFQDALLLPGEIKELHKAIKKKNLELRFAFQTRVDALDEKSLRLLKEAGCWRIAVGTESFSNHVLRGVNKKTTIEKTFSTLEYAKKLGLRIDLFMMIALPNETREGFRENLETIKKIDAEVAGAIATPIPGTQLWKQGLKEGTLKKGDWKECLEKKGMVGTGFSKQEIEEMRREFYLAAAGKKVREKPFDALKRAVRQPRKALDYGKFLLKR